MQGVAPSRWLEAVEQEPHLLRSHSLQLHRTSNGNANRFLLKSGRYMRIHAVVFIVAAIVFLIASAWRCLFPRSRGSISGLRRRRLASGGGQQDEGDGQERPQVCEDLEELLAAEGGEDFASNLPPPQPAGTSVGAAADDEQPRKKKRKTKRHAEDGDETSEQQAKRARENEQEMLPMEWIESFLLSLEEPNPRSPTPPFIAESAESGDSATLAERLAKGETTFAEWLFDPEDDLPLTTEEERRPQDSGDLSPLEGTSSDFVYYAPSHAMEGRGPREPSGDTEMPSTSGAVSGVQPLSSQPPPSHVSQPSQVPQSVSRPEGSAAPPRRRIVRRFNPLRSSRSLKANSTLVSLLRPLEELLRKQSHSEEDLQAIINVSENVYKFFDMRPPRESNEKRADRLIRLVVLRLVVVHAMWRACDVVGSAMRKDEWWFSFMSIVYGDAMRRRRFTERSKHAALLQRIIAVLESFSHGVPPPPEELAEIMRTVFHRQTGIVMFKDPAWDLWREGDEDS